MADSPNSSGTGAARRSSAVSRARRLVVRWQLALLLILLAGGALRFHGLDWDQPAGAPGPLQMHPDERFLSLVSSGLDWPDSPGAYFDTEHSPLNPYNSAGTHSYVYGTFPLFLARAASSLTGDPTYDRTVVWGRRLTASIDTATIAVLFALGWTLFGRRVGLLGAAFYALAVLPTQLAHFWTMDPYVTFFATLTLLLSALLVTARGRVSRPVLGAALALAVGLGLASKVTAWPLALGPTFAMVARIALRDLGQLGLRWRGRTVTSGNWAADIVLLLVVGAAAFVVFRIAQPYAFEGPHAWDIHLSSRWLSDIRREIDFQNGNVDFPPFVQFAGRTPFIAPVQQITLWGLGPPLGVAAWLSCIVAGVLLFRRRELTFALPLLSAVAVLGFQGPRFVAFMRYFEPLYPVLCLFAAWGCVALLATARDWKPGRFRPSQRVARIAAIAVVVLVAVPTLWWALAFQSVYNGAHPRLQASAWIYNNVPADSTITYELWDDSVPYALPGQPAGSYRMIETTPYDTDSPEKVRELIYGRPGDQVHGGLDRADYIAITSNRVRDSVSKLEREYPATIRYYQLLDSGALGFERVATFHKQPTFLGISINDQGAEESFTVYDHPEVRLYRKTAAWDPAKAYVLLLQAHPERAVNLLPRQGATNGLQFTPAEAAVQQSGGTFSQIFDARGWASGAPWLWWLLFIEVSAFASLSWLTWLCRALPDRGYGLSKVVGLISVVLPTWLLVAWGGPHFSGGLVWVVYGVVVAFGLAIAVVRRDALAYIASQRWLAWLATEAVFIAVFAGFLLLRAYNPDLWFSPQGGEKPMELAYLTAVAKSTTLPPYDPWFAGGSMNYYYMGWFFVSVPMRALRIFPEIAFNLAIPTFAALAASVAFSMVHNLVSFSARARPVTGGRAANDYAVPVFAGLFGALLLVAFANLDGAVQTVERFQSLATTHLDTGLPVVGGVVSFASGAWQWATGAGSLPPFDWWRSSRVHFGQFDITEFPYWTFLFGDLHAHLMDLPFFGLTIALAVTYIGSASLGLRRQCWALAPVLGLALGLVRTIHTWDFPTAVLIAATAIVAGQVLARGRWQQRWWDAVGHLVLTAGVLVVAFTPFTAHFETFESGLIRAPETTKPQHYFTHFGVFLAFGLAFVAVRYHEELRARGGEGGRNPFFLLLAGRWELLGMAVFAAGLGAFMSRFGLTVVALSVVLELFLLNLLWLEFRAAEHDIGRLLATAMFTLAFAIAAGTDVVTLKDDIERMNTVFKFLLQAWQLFALASAFAGWYVARYLWRADGWRLQPLAGRRLAAWAGTVTAAGLLCAASLFPLTGTAARQDARFTSLGPTLDGLAYLPYGTYDEDHGTEGPADDAHLYLGDDWPLIRWLRDNAEGSPVIVEAVGPLYHWTGRISWNTGLPAVIGWDWHETQQRHDYASLIVDRRTATERFYTDPGIEAANAYLRKYNVTYVIVGTEEHVYGSPAGLGKLDHMPALTAVYRAGDNTIYRVNQQSLTGP